MNGEIMTAQQMIDTARTCQMELQHIHGALLAAFHAYQPEAEEWVNLQHTLAHIRRIANLTIVDLAAIKQWEH